MSHSFYNTSWQQCMEELCRLIELENPPPLYSSTGKLLPPKVLTQQQAFQHYAALYIGYLKVFQSLEACYDQIVHPQKRRDIRLVLECVMARLVQCKAELIRFNANTQGIGYDFVHFTDILLANRLTPKDLEVPIPRYFREKTAQDLTNVTFSPISPNHPNNTHNSNNSNVDDSAKKRDVLEKYMEEHQITVVIEEKTLFVPKLTREQAIRIIQQAERGRQGIVRAKLMKELKEEDLLRKRLNQSAAGEGNNPSFEAELRRKEPNFAATTIQRVFRGYLSRRKVRKMQLEELIFIGMKPNPEHSAARIIPGASNSADFAPASTTQASLQEKPRYDPITKAGEIREQRKLRQSDNELKYIEGLMSLEQEILDKEGSELRDKLWQERYDWWINYKQRTGKFPKDLALFYKEKQLQAGIVPEKKKKIKKKAKESEKTQQNQRKPSEKASKTSKNSGKGEENIEVLGPNHLVQHLVECLSHYNSVWSGLDESSNYLQQHSVALAQEKLRPIIEEKVQSSVDSRLLQYLDNIRQKLMQKQAEKKAKKLALREKKRLKAQEGDNSDQTGEKGSSTGRSGLNNAGSGAGGVNSPSKGPKKAGKGKKSAKCCDGAASCAQMPLGDQISLLVRMGILYDYKKNINNKLNLGAFVGELELLGTEYNAAELCVEPNYAQLRHFLAEQVILPLGSAYVKQQTNLINSVLLYGPPGCGKSHLSRAIAYESAAVWLELSPRAILHKLGSKAEINKLVHLVFNVAISLQPAVIYLDEVEKLFISSKKKGQINTGNELAKLRAAIQQHKKLLSRENRVIILANSSQPWNERIDRTEFNKMFGKSAQGKQIAVPLPNYNTRLLLWRRLLTSTGLKIDNFVGDAEILLANLARISEGYSVSSIQHSVALSLTPRTVAKLNESNKLVELNELISALSKTSFYYKGDYALFKKYFEGQINETQRKKIQAIQQEEQKIFAAEQQKKNRTTMKRIA
jgi:hypothetical protein